MPFRFLFRRPSRQDAVEAAYRTIVAQARLPVFYAECGVPDTVDGRFELIALHAFLVLNRLKAAHDGGEGGVVRDFGQRLFDFMFADMDQALREMGVGDLSVGREVKRMAKAFYGRAAAYEAGLRPQAGEGGVLGDALRRNLFGTAMPGRVEVARVAAYMEHAAESLARTAAAAILAGRFGFPPVA